MYKGTKDHTSEQRPNTILNVIESEAWSTVVQFKKETIFILYFFIVIVFVTRHADCRMIFVLYPTFYILIFL